MAEGSVGEWPSRKEQGSASAYKQEIVQYQDGQLAISITGERGSKFEFDTHKYSPTKYMHEGVIKTRSGNDYYIFNKNRRTFIINTRETANTGKLVAVFEDSPARLPPVEFEKPWDVPGFYKTTAVENILLRYKVALPGNNVGRKIDSPNPFDKYDNYKRLL